MIERSVAGLALAAAVALFARRAGSLSSSGAVAATIVGTASVAAGWDWGAVLIAYFVGSVVLSRVGAAAKAARTGAIVAKGGRRDATQVLANGGLFALLALLAPATRVPGLAACAALGALAAATADTWATEIGTLARGAPRSVRTLRPVPVGTSGGVSIQGTLALCAGSLFVAVLSRALDLTEATLAVVAGGVAGALTDSVLGATVQERRWCGVCARATERRVHDCGQRTRHAGGVSWFDNDVVNFTATLAGAAVAALAFSLRGRPA